jgi:hypothetical protein
VVAWIGLLLLLGPADRVVQSDRHQVRVEAPPGWTPQRQSAYPNVVAILTHRDGGRITLTAQRLRGGETPAQLAERSRPALLRQDMKIERLAPSAFDSNACEITATSRDGKSELRQIYFIHGANAYVLTLAGAVAKQAQYNKDFEVTWHGIVFLEAAPKHAPE